MSERLPGTLEIRINTAKIDRIYNNMKRGQDRCDFSTKETPLNTLHIASFLLSLVSFNKCALRYIS